MCVHTFVHMNQKRVIESKCTYTVVCFGCPTKKIPTTDKTKLAPLLWVHLYMPIIAIILCGKVHLWLEFLNQCKKGKKVKERVNYCQIPCAMSDLNAQLKDCTCNCFNQMQISPCICKIGVCRCSAHTCCCMMTVVN